MPFQNQAWVPYLPEFPNVGLLSSISFYDVMRFGCIVCEQTWEITEERYIAGGKPAFFKKVAETFEPHRHDGSELDERKWVALGELLGG